MLGRLQGIRQLTAQVIRGQNRQRKPSSARWVAFASLVPCAVAMDYNYSPVRAAPQTMGGHEAQIKFDGNKMTKVAPESEAVTYRAIYGQIKPTDTTSTFRDSDFAETTQPFTADQLAQLQQLKTLVPTFHGAESIQGGVHLSKKKGTTAEACSLLTLENMCYGVSDGSAVMDVKIGTSTVTVRSKRNGGVANAQQRAITDKERHSEELGFVVVGFAVDGEKTRWNKKSTINPGNVREYLRKPFTHKGQVNTEAVNHAIAELNKLIKHFSTVNTFEVRGCSVFFVLDHEKNDFRVKLIDLSSLEDKGKRDEGFLKGLQNLRKHLLGINGIQASVG